VSSGGPDLFVICKKCGSEVSPYITECPYCGTRLRKRAPRLDRPPAPEGGLGRRRAKRKAVAPSLGRLRRGEIPGIRGDRRPYATIAIVLISLVGAVFWRTGLIGLHSFVLAGPLHGDWWRLLTSPLTYGTTGYALVALSAVGIFGWLLERRHGPAVVLVLLLLGGVGGMAVVAASYAFPLAIGGNGVALAFLAAWAVPDLIDARHGREVEGDLIGAGVFAAALLALPLVSDEADPLAGAVGLVAGLLAGHVLARFRPA
jgi:hypothetical protein